MDPQQQDEMDTLLARQEELGKEIETLVKNYNKDGKARKNQAYYEKRLKQLDEFAKEFDENNERLKDFQPQFKSSDYFTKQYDVMVKKLVKQYTDILAKGLKEASEKSDQPPENINTASSLIRRQKVIISSLQRVLKSTEPETESSPSFKVKQKLWEEIQELHFKIWETIDKPVEIGYDMEMYTTLETRMMDLFKSAIQPKNSTTSMVNDSALTSKIPLPKISIPKFDGDYAKWPTFSDLFEKVIHEQPISAVQKMWFLKTNLTGEAERLIRHLALTDNNYETSWKILKDRFSNKRVLASTIIQQLIDTPNVTNDANAIKTLHDVVQESLAALNNVNITTKNWDPLLLQILIKKLDRHTHGLYEQAINKPREVQTIDHFLEFLEQRFQALESLGSKDKAKKDDKQNSSNKATSASITSTTCKACDSKDHAIYFCKKFIDKKPKERYQWVQTHKLCINCLKSGHRAQSCASRSCKYCSKKHNSLLHFESKSKPQNSNKAANQDTSTLSSNANTPNTTTTSSETSNTPSVVATTNNTAKKINELQNYVLLATAKVKIIANNGQACEVRAVLDAGSQVNLISQRLINKLSLSTTRAQLNIEGVGQHSGNSNSRVNVGLQSHNGTFSTRLEAFVIPQIISAQPSRNIDISTWKIPENLELADPYFHRPEKIDILIGAEHYHHLLHPEQLLLGSCLPLLQNTVLGWIVIGKAEMATEAKVTCAIFAPEEEKVSDLIEKFWKIDSFDDQNGYMTANEKHCETHFANTISRHESGKFIVKLPFADNPSTLGNSQIQAERRFQSIERKLKGDPNLQHEYKKFMHEYEALGHMQRIRKEDIPSANYFIPHHCVLKPDSSTTKLRVVFDASAKTSTGRSLNDILHKGPTVQSELFSILLRFRLHKFVFTADIEKMYRQILIHDDDTAYQLIIWRENEEDEYGFYKLKTVTYGTTSAPYLATKCLQHLATQNKAKYPLGSEVVHEDFYVDDCLSGANDITTAQEMQRQIKSLLGEAGFKLRKWCANNNRLLSEIPAEDQEINLDLERSSDQTIKTLGLIWLPKTDELCGRAHISPLQKITKRTVSSDLARIFDPLGLFGPVTVKAKLFMQQLWELKMDWDQVLSMQLQHQWTQFRNDLTVLNNLKTFRHVFHGKTPAKIQIHTFVDASERAYGAAVYMRAINTDKSITVQLLCAKSRIAPMKKLTIPRLELCAAVLGAELTNRVLKDIKITDISTFLWSDSTIVLSWIQSPSATLHTFVSNRISVIQQLTAAEQWHHVSSVDNPADVLSRGMSPEKLKSHSAWFYGPFFLSGKKEWWTDPISKIPEIPDDMERRTQRVMAVTHQQAEIENIIYSIEHRNSFKFLQHVVAYLQRPFLQPKPQQIAVSPIELRHALLIIIRTIQLSEFSQEMKDLKAHKTVAHSSKLSTLAPFIDPDDGTLRVGGRLVDSNLPKDAKHPMVLPYNDYLVKLLLKQTHEENNHCGIQSLLANIRQTFWPINGKTMARNVVHNCIRCSRANPKLMNQVMGNLPCDRVTMTRPFLTTGVDYCGPFAIHYKIRGKKPTKAYIAVFCCFATKAVHLELVTDLTTAGFLGALQRFTGRRGRCKTIYCDNATNFKGASNQLAELDDVIFSTNAQEQIIRDNSNRGINFKFIPPRAPNFGGLWEAEVKSAKYLLVRGASSASLTYEELETVMIGIEAILNSRPLTPMSSDPNDLSAITPGHFLIGEPLTSIPDPHKSDDKLTIAQRWELVSRLKHDFWKRWSHEYLSELQYRRKWKTESDNLKENDMVIVKDENLPVMQWPIGRVNKICRGSDGHVRVADIKTSKGIFRRSIRQLAPLPTAAAINSHYDQLEGTNHIERTQQKPGQLQTRTTSLDTIQQQSTQLKRSSSLLVSIPLTRLQGTERFKNKSQTLMNSEDLRSNKRPRMAAAPSMMSIVVIALLLFPMIFATPIMQHKFPNKPGLYFEGIGTLNRVVAEWRIITYYDLAPIQNELHTFRNGTILLENLCHLLQQEKMCSELIKHFKSINIELPIASSTKRRKARGAFNIVGNIANKLFGVLDNEYAEDVSKLIKQLNDNDNVLTEMIQNQTTVIDATLNVVKKESEKIEIKINALQQEVNSINKNMIDMTKRVNLLEVYMSTATQLTLLSSDLQRLEADLFDVLTDTRHGKISPLLISPLQLQHEIIKIREHLPHSLRLPFNQNDVIHMYNLMTSESGISSDHIIFILRLPLTNNEAFNLFNIIPIPAVVNDTMIIIEPETALLAVTPFRDQYFALTNEDLKSCRATKQGSNQLLCSDKQTKYHQGATAYMCEFNLLKNGTDENCMWKKSKSDTIWSPLQHSNQWIFASKHVTQLSAVCHDTTQLVELQGSNLLTLQNDCTIKHHTATIQAHQIYSDTIYESHAAFGNFNPLNKSTMRISLIDPPLDLSNEIEKLRQLHETISSEKLIHLPTLVKHQNIHHYIISYAALILIICTIIWLSWKLKKSRQRISLDSKSPPNPAPRFSIDPEIVT